MAPRAGCRRPAGEAQGDREQPEGLAEFRFILVTTMSSRRRSTQAVSPTTPATCSGRDVAVRVAAEVGGVAAGVQVGDVADLKHRARGGGHWPAGMRRTSLMILQGDQVVAIEARPGRRLTCPSRYMPNTGAIELRQRPPASQSKLPPAVSRAVERPRPGGAWIHGHGEPWTVARVVTHRFGVRYPSHVRVLQRSPGSARATSAGPLVWRSELRGGLQRRHDDRGRRSASARTAASPQLG
jgi:hypothetical protein